MYLTNNLGFSQRSWVHWRKLRVKRHLMNLRRWRAFPVSSSTKVPTFSSSIFPESSKEPLKEKGAENRLFLSNNFDRNCRVVKFFSFIDCRSSQLPVLPIWCWWCWTPPKGTSNGCYWRKNWKVSVFGWTVTNRISTSRYSFKHCFRSCYVKTFSLSPQQHKKGGGVAFNAVCPLTKVDEKLVQLILHEYKIFNAEVTSVDWLN